ncbi:MAG: dodecin family protein [Actinomycetota bacterium]|nr:dodecin family protein [Actinomycetota bacterium]
MSVAKVIEVSARSAESFDAAIREGIAKATETVRDIKQAWVKDQLVLVEDGQIVGYEVDLKISFLVA